MINHEHCKYCLKRLGNDMQLSDCLKHIRQCKKTHMPKQEEKEQFVYEKIPIDNTHTKFNWEKRAKKKIDSNIKTLSQDKIKQMSFQEKQYWLRSKLESIRIPWTQGADYIKLSRENLLESTLNSISQVNLRKQVKVQFIEQKMNDAGGLLRQLIYMIVKQIFHIETGIFLLAKTQESMYNLKWDQEVDQHFSSSLLNLLGMIIGKAIFERITLSCYLDRTIIKQICKKKVELADIFGYDQQLYKNLKSCLESQNIDDLDVYFVTYKNNGGKIQQYELLEGSRDIKVEEANKKLYIQLLIQTHTMNHVVLSIKNLLNGINKVFPTEWLEIFQPYQMEMIMYGIPVIFIEDWQENTIYKQPYDKNHHIIIWFWAVMKEFDEDQLSKILHFCTGSIKIPIHGFNKLESNRGNCSKFEIVPIQYNKNNLFPRAHTCFNRLELPQYPNFQILKTHLTAISKNDFAGVFGLD